MSSVTKLCADHLRAFSNQHSVKLKSGHAHELVAAYFGYKSKAAMLADTFFSPDNFALVQLLVLTPSMFIDDRRNTLENLPPDLADTYTLSEEMFVKLIADKGLSFKVFPSWTHLAEALTTEHLCKFGGSILPASFGHNERAKLIFNKPLYEFNPNVVTSEKEVELQVKNRYYGSQDINFKPIDVLVTIKLQRVVGHIGYADPKISAELLNGTAGSSPFSQEGNYNV